MSLVKLILFDNRVVYCYIRIFLILLPYSVFYFSNITGGSCDHFARTICGLKSEICIMTKYSLGLSRTVLPVKFMVDFTLQIYTPLRNEYIKRLSCSISFHCRHQDVTLTKRFSFFFFSFFSFFSFCHRDVVARRQSSRNQADIYHHYTIPRAVGLKVDRFRKK